MKVARNNILEFLKISQDLTGIGSPANPGGGTHFPTSSDRALTFQISRSHLQESKYAISFSIGALVRRRRATQAGGGVKDVGSDELISGSFNVVDNTSWGF